MKKAIFSSVLKCVCTTDIPNVKTVSEATELLIAADKSGCVHLKLHLESMIANAFIKVDNAAEMLVFGDSYYCALLKEVAMKMIAANLDDTMKSDRWSAVK